MPGLSKRRGLAGALALGLLLMSGSSFRTLAQTVSPPMKAGDALTISNLAQLTEALRAEDRLYANVRLEAVVCSSSTPELGVLVVQDSTGVELLELGRQSQELRAGDRLELAGTHLFLRRREMGTQICTAPVVVNDGLHMARPVAGEVFLRAGRIPVELDWFNGFRNFALDIACQRPKGRLERIPDSALTHAQQPGSEAGLKPGLRAECFLGYWEQVPDFDLLQPIKSGTSANFDVASRTQDEKVGLRFTGFFQAPTDGLYTFRVTSDDGSLLFLGEPVVAWKRLGTVPPPAPQPALLGQSMENLQERRWVSVVGRVNFIYARGRGLELELCSGADTISVKVADASGAVPDELLNTSVRAVGIGRAAFADNQRIVLDRVFVARGSDLKPLQSGIDTAANPLAFRDIAQVQAMQSGDARRELPVRVRGVVTAANRTDRWMSLQDDTRGIFVDVHAVSNFVPATAELWEVAGHTAAGNFAPIIVAEQMTRLGHGRLPRPARPSWSELANGSMDVQWVEFQGLVSEVHSNVLGLLLPEGTLQVSMDNHFESELRRFEHAVVRVRGTLFAVWNADTREVQFGSVLMRNARINVDIPAPADAFNAPTKSARELLLFDAKATPFRTVKVRVQVLHADAQTVFAAEDGMGLRLFALEKAVFRPGDLVEAVGYPEISGPSPALREALIRKTGWGALGAPRVLTAPDLARKGLDSTLVRVKAKLMSIHSEQNSTVLELQAGGQLFVARLTGGRALVAPRIGSSLELTGVYVAAGRKQPDGRIEPFELLLNSAADLRVLSQPSWWTLERLGAVVGFLLVVLALAAGWITQLRSQVEQRTVELQREIRERESAEHERVLEEERSRIARDLHDDLGASLTEIGVLASTGQRANNAPNGAPELFNAIAGKARGSIAALDVIVWAVDPEDNSLQSLADYLSGFAGEYLSHSNLACRFKIPVSFPPVTLLGRIRHDLFLAVKEALNNVVRHARATEVEFGVGLLENTLEVVIADNGVGFDPQVARGGNGLTNLHERLNKLGGSCVLDSHPGLGTTVSIRLPLPKTEAGRPTSS